MFRNRPLREPLDRIDVLLFYEGSAHWKAIPLVRMKTFTVGKTNSTSSRSEVRGMIETTLHILPKNPGEKPAKKAKGK